MAREKLRFSIVFRDSTNQTRGKYDFEGRPLGRMPRHQIARLGVARTFQNLALFSTMTVRENVCVGAHALVKGGFLGSAFDASACALRGAGDRQIGGCANRGMPLGLGRAPACRRTAVRPEKAGRARSRARYFPETTAARRTGCGSQSRGGRRARRRDRRHPRPARRRCAAGRASHEFGHARLRSGRRARLRASNCRRDARRSARTSRRHPRIPGAARRERDFARRRPQGLLWTRRSASRRGL